MGYDQVSLPVVDADKRLIGRLMVAHMVDFIPEEIEAKILGQAGLKEEDIFAPVLRSIKSRWACLAVNLVTAVLASRVIDLFQDSIAQRWAGDAASVLAAGRTKPRTAPVEPSGGWFWHHTVALRMPANRLILSLVRLPAISSFGPQEGPRHARRCIAYVRSTYREWPAWRRQPVGQVAVRGR